MNAMQTLYKLTDEKGNTYNGYVYGYAGKVHKKPFKKNPELCSSSVFHAYKNYNLAFLLNPIHANFSSPRLWEIRGDVLCSDFGKIGSFTQEVVKELEIPSWVNSDSQKLVRVQFAVLCAESVLQQFTDKYPADERVNNALKAAKNYLHNPCDEAAGAAAEAARAAARAAVAAWAAEAAAGAAWAAEAAAWAAAWAAGAARAAARATARAAARAAGAAAVAADLEIDFCKLADKAVRLVMHKDK